jgi:hypothetical protein
VLRARWYLAVGLAAAIATIEIMASVQDRDELHP